METDIRIVIVAFDGLRPDMVDEDLTPNLAAFCRQGSHCTDSRGVFPTETRVNQASLITGRHPSGHGMVANKFREATAGGTLNTADFAALSLADETLGGIMTAPSLGQILHDAGHALAVVGCGTPGGNRILHNHAEALDALNISLHGLDKTTTPGAGEALVEAHGPIPEAALPNLDRIDWVVDAYMQQVATQRDPTVAILWFSDPDTPFHYRGIESPEAAAAIRHADAALGRLMQWRRESGREQSLQIIALSDHGHVATHGPALELEAKFTEAGFQIGEGGEASLIPGTCAALYAKNSAIQARLVSWLQAQPWCGPIFARAMDGGDPPPGALPLAAANLEHVRTGDIVFVLARDEGAPNGGLLGRCLHDNPDIPIGCGMHGGLSPYEVSTMLAFSGSLFASQRQITTPTGIIDVLPTMLHALGLESPPTDGRILHEILAGFEGVPPNAERQRTSAENGPDYQQSIQADLVGASRYLAHGQRHGGPGII
jgi:phosphonoacetate hydrolase